MQRLEVRGAERPLYGSLGVKGLIGVAISGDRNVIKKEAEKILKYKDLTIEIQRMWNIKTKVKERAIPLQAWTGPEGSRKLRFPDFVTTAQDGGKVVRLKHRPPLPPGNTPGTHFC